MTTKSKTPTPRTQPVEAETPPVRTAWLTGGVPMAVLMLIVVTSLYMQVPQSTASAEPARNWPANPNELPGFRADAWFLPADELLGFVEVPGGPFLMGSDPAVDPLAFENELWVDGGGRRPVELAAFYMGRYEVTVAQYKEFVEATGHRADPQSLQAPPAHPVTNVSWTDALAYARWLDGVLRSSSQIPSPLAQLVRDGWVVSLPDEAQWEKAARGTDGRIYPWGDEPRRDRANFQGRGTLPVGSFDCPECPFGLADMSGNVWEWTRTPFQAGPHGAPAVGANPEADALWTMRGGSFGDPERNVRAALRGGADPGARRPFIGFRLVLTRGS